MSGPTARRKAIEHPGRFAIVAGGLTLVALLFAGAIMTADTKDVKRLAARRGATISPARFDRAAAGADRRRPA